MGKNEIRQGFVGKKEIRQGFCIENLSGCTERNDADYSTGIHPDYLED